MKLVGLKPYQNGFTGVIDETDRYVFFNCTGAGRIRRLIDYDKTDYETYGDFLNVMAKFIPLKFFFKRPLPIASLCPGELKQIAQTVEPLRFHTEPFDPKRPPPPRKM